MPSQIASLGHPAAGGWLVNSGRTVFSQLIDCLPEHGFPRCVRRNDGERRVLTFSFRDQFRRHKSRVKLHTLIDLRGNISSFILYHLCQTEAIGKSTAPHLTDSNDLLFENRYFSNLEFDPAYISVITMVERTKAYSQLASIHYDYLGIGLLAAGMYFLVGLPFVRLARLAERYFTPGRIRRWGRSPYSTCRHSCFALAIQDRNAYCFPLVAVL
jgi:hypothetical protein